LAVPHPQVGLLFRTVARITPVGNDELLQQRCRQFFWDAERMGDGPANVPHAELVSKVVLNRV
jgi:hypothetical protein